MTVNSNILKSGPYNTDGTTKAFSVTFQYLEDSDIVVTLLNTTTNAVLVGTLTTDYTITDNTPPLIGGTVTIANNGFGGIANASGVIAAGYTVTLTSSIPVLQQESYPNAGLFPSAQVEQGLDRLTLICQNLELSANSSLKFPVTDSALISTTLPNSGQRANAFLGFDASGNPIAVAGASSVTISTAMVPVVQSVTTMAAAELLLNGNIASLSKVVVDTNVLEQLTASVNSYAQEILQNTSNGATASTDITINNNLGTATTFYGNFGMNSSGFTGTGSFNKASAVYLTSTSGDLVLGSTTANALRFVYNSGTSDSMFIDATGVNIPTAIITTATITTLNLTSFATPPTITTPASAGDVTNKIATMSNFAQGANGATEVLLGTLAPSNSSVVSFTSIPGGYDQYVVRLTNIVPATNNVALMAWASENNGTSYLNTGWQGETWVWNTSNGSAANSNPSTGGIQVLSAIGSSNPGFTGQISVGALGGTTNNKGFNWQGMAGNLGCVGFAWYNTDTNAFNALQFYFSSGNIASGKLSLYGIRNS